MTELIIFFISITYGIPIYLLAECFIRLKRIEEKIDKLPHITERDFIEKGE